MLLSTSAATKLNASLFLNTPKDAGLEDDEDVVRAMPGAPPVGERTCDGVLAPLPFPKLNELGPEPMSAPGAEMKLKGSARAAGLGAATPTPPPMPPNEVGVALGYMMGDCCGERGEEPKESVLLALLGALLGNDDMPLTALLELRKEKEDDPPTGAGLIGTGMGCICTCACACGWKDINGFAPTEPVRAGGGADMNPKELCAGAIGCAMGTTGALALALLLLLPLLPLDAPKLARGSKLTSMDESRRRFPAGCTGRSGVLLIDAGAGPRSRLPSWLVTEETAGAGCEGYACCAGMEVPTDMPEKRPPMLGAGAEAGSCETTAGAEAAGSEPRDMPEKRPPPALPPAACCVERATGGGILTGCWYEYWSSSRSKRLLCCCCCCCEDIRS